MGLYQSKFNKVLDELYRSRTDKLRHLLDSGKKKKARSFNRNLLDKKTKELKNLASDALLIQHFQKEFKNRVYKKNSWFWMKSKGFNRDQKSEHFEEWYNNIFLHRNKCIYIIWDEGKCLYVGKTEQAPGRITSHFYEIKFAHPTRIDVYLTRGKRDLSILECLAIHKYKPSKNQLLAAKKKYTSECSLCKINRRIDKEMRRIFVRKRG